MPNTSVVACLLLVVLCGVVSQATGVKRAATKLYPSGCYFQGKWFPSGQYVDKEKLCLCMKGMVACIKRRYLFHGGRNDYSDIGVEHLE